MNVRALTRHCWKDAGEIVARFREAGPQAAWINARTHASNLRLRIAERLNRRQDSECPCCGWHGYRFRALDVQDRVLLPNVCCNCGSQPRQRLLLTLFHRRVIFAEMRGIFLHFAPEPSLRNALETVPGLTVFGADLAYNILRLWPGRSFRGDITRMPVQDNSVDYLACIHVLEHIVDEQQAIAELFRILKPGGVAVIMVPARTDISETVEFDRKIVKPFRHVRDYAFSDVAQRLRVFDVTTIRPAEFLTAEEVRRYGIWDEDAIFVCRKAPPSVSHFR